MKIEQINSNAKVRHVDDTMVEIGLPEVSPISLYPGAVSKIRTGVKLTLEQHEAAAIAFTQAVAESGVTLAHPSLITDSTDGELVISVFNRSSFVRTLEPDKPLFCLVTVARGSKIVGQPRVLIEKVTEKVPATVTVGKGGKPEPGAVGVARRAARKVLGLEPADAD